MAKRHTSANLDALFKANRMAAREASKAAAMDAIKPTLQEQAMGVQAAGNSQAFDSFTNVLARTGYGTPNLAEGTEYVLRRFTLSYWNLISMYEGSWITRRIVELPAQCMVKAWPRLTSEIEPTDITRIDRALRRTNAKAQILTSITWARLFGGAGCLIAVKGQDKELDQPLDLDSIGVGDFSGLIPFDRWAGIYPGTNVCEDISRPIDFGLPESYEVRPQGGQNFRVHASRILRFTGPTVPSPEKEAYSTWGISVIEPVLQAIQAYDNISFNILALSFRANILGMKFPELAQMLSGLGSSAQATLGFEQRMTALNHLISSQSLVPLPKDGSIEATAYSFSGLSEVFQQFQLAVSGAAQIPVTRLWGKTITGLGNGDNEGDARVFEEKIATDQDTDLRPQLEKLYPVICASELGEVPDDLDLTFPSIRVLDEKEKAELSKTVVDTVMVAMNGAVISPRTAGKELKQSSDMTGIFTNITDEDIEALSDEIQPEGEVGGDLFGGEGGGLNPASGPAKVLKEEDKEGKAKAQPEATEAIRETQAPSNGHSDDGFEGLKRLAKAADAKYTPELVWLEAMDNEADTIPRSLRGTEEGQRLCRQHAAANISFYAEQFHVDVDKCKAYARTKAFDAGLREGVKNCQWCGDALDGDDVAEIGRSVVCPACADAYGRGRAKDVATSGLSAGDQLRVNGKTLTVRQVVHNTKDLFGNPTVQVIFETGEVLPYRVDGDVIVDGKKNQGRGYDADGPHVGPRRKVHGLGIVVETPRGYERHGKDDKGKPWSVTMGADYGYIKGHKGADGDSLDCYIGPDPSSEWCYIVDQAVLGNRKRYDEAKVMLGFKSQGDALRTYKANHHKAADVYLDFTPMHIDDFKEWLVTRDWRKPCSPEVRV